MVLRKHGFADEWLEDHTLPPLPTGFRSNGKAVGRFLFGLSCWLSGRESACMQETQVPSLSQEDPLEEDMATHSSILAWRIPRTEEPGGLQSMGSHRVGHD